MTIKNRSAKLLSLVLFALCVLTSDQLLAADLYWNGLNVSGGTADGDVNDGANWNDQFNAVANVVPGVGDTAHFLFNTTDTDITIPTGGSFAPDRIYYDASVSSSSTSDILLDKSLTLTDITMAGFNSGSSNRDTNRLRVGVNNAVTLDLTGPTPLDKTSSSLVRWKFIELTTGNVTVNLSNPAIDFAPSASPSTDALDFTSYNILGGTDQQTALADNSVINFTAVGGSVNLQDQGLFGATIGLGRNRLAVRSDQTWTADSAAFLSFVDRHNTGGGAGPDLIESIDGGNLNNLGQVNLYITRGGGDTTNATNGMQLVGGTYGSIHLSNGNTSLRTRYLNQKDAVTLQGEAVKPDHNDGTTNNPNSVISGYGLVVNVGQRASETRWHYNTAGFDLNVSQGVLLESLADASTLDEAVLNAEGSTVTIGGDLNFYALNSNAASLNSATRKIGISGDAGTEILVAGNFITNVKSYDGTNALNLSNVTANGGGGLQTWEVGDAAATVGVQPDSYSMATFNIGNGSTSAYVQLVNDYLNDNPITNGTQIINQGDEFGNVYVITGPAFVPDEVALNPDLDKVGEKLIVGTLSIAANSLLDANLSVASVEIGTALILDSTAMLDLNTGMSLTAGGTLDNFVGLGDQTAAWSAFKAQVIDSSNPGYMFTPVLNGSSNTVWQVIAPVPEPGSVSMVLCGLMGLLRVSRKRRSRRV